MPYYSLVRREDGSWDLCDGREVVTENIDYADGMQKLSQGVWGPHSVWKPPILPVPDPDAVEVT